MSGRLCTVPTVHTFASGKPQCDPLQTSGEHFLNKNKTFFSPLPESGPSLMELSTACGMPLPEQRGFPLSRLAAKSQVRPLGQQRGALGNQSLELRLEEVSCAF